MKQVAIIGAGQLGARHLQGVLKSKASLSVSVVDPKEESLKVSKIRADEVNHAHDITFINYINELPPKLDIVIVATNSDVRAKVITELLSKKEVDFLVLEKVLFQTINDYDLIGKLCNAKGVKTYVNHPRRMQPFYQSLQTELSKQELANVAISVYGQNWGMGCNGLHFLDIITFLTSDTIKNLDTAQLDKKNIDSKRLGYKEFTGVLQGKFGRGGRFTITSVFNKKEEVAPIIVVIAMPNKRIIIQEGAETSVIHLNKEENFKPKSAVYPMLFQSDLTTSVINDLLERGGCDLPTYEEARVNHELFISAFLDFYNAQTQNNTDICPIT